MRFSDFECVGIRDEGRVLGERDAWADDEISASDRAGGFQGTAGSIESEDLEFQSEESQFRRGAILDGP